MPSGRKTQLKEKMDDKNKEVVVEPVVEIDPIAAKDAEIAKISQERDNYKHVALKRLGKNPGDADFIAGTDEKTGLTVEETVKKTLLDGEYAKLNAEKDEIARKLVKENSELKLALKNRPAPSIGGGSGEALEVKDNVLSEQQIAKIRATGERLKVKDIDAYVEKAKANILKNR